jgi:hypothetical protein
MPRLERDRASHAGRAPNSFCWAAEHSGNNLPEVCAQDRRDLNRAAIVEWVRTVAQDALIFHVANGELRSKADAARMRWIGVLAAVPYLVVVAPGERIFFTEVKTEDDVRLAFAAWRIQTREDRP